VLLDCTRPDILWLAYAHVSVAGICLPPAVYPDLAPRQIDVPLDYINSSLGLQLEPSAVAKLLRSMQLQVELTQAAAADGSSSSSSSGRASLLVSVPPTRSDILHACDVMEDVAIAYGYNNLSKQVRASTRCIAFACVCLCVPQCLFD
jgi:phenylalanyl-tRNA synthetase beta chain